MEQPVVAALHVTHVGNRAQTLELHNGESVTLGRDVSNSLVLDDPGASRIHATFSASLNGLVIADLGSTNGTFVNGERISALHNLTTGDIVDVGATKISIELKADKLVSALSSSFSSRALTAQLKRLSVAVLVISVSGFEKLQQKFSQEEVRHSFGHWHKVVAASIRDFGGEVDKVVAGSIVAFWKGAEEKKLAVKAAYAALQIRELCDDFSEHCEWKHHQESPWKCTLVLSSGSGLTGTVGGEGGQGSFTILGDPVTTAFQLENLVSKLGEQLIIAGPTAQLLREAFVISKVIKVKLKNAPDGLETYTITN